MRGIAPFLATDMARCTRHQSVTALQGEVAGAMVEQAEVHRRGLEVTSLVVRMTKAALGVLDVLTLAVKALGLRNVAFYGLMAIEAQRVLLFLGEWFVASIAVLLQLGMAFNQRAGREQLLNGILRHRGFDPNSKGNANEDDRCPCNVPCLPHPTSPASSSFNRDERPQHA